MTLTIIPFVLGPIENNSFLLVEEESRTACVIDPSFDSGKIVNYCREKQIMITHILCTHAHFDHIAGVDEIAASLTQPPMITLHSLDFALWKNNGAARTFGIPFEIKTTPNQFVEQGQFIQFGKTQLEVRFTPGHTKGHVVYTLQDLNVVFSGDLIFRQSVGRTDLEGGNQLLLIRSIKDQVFSLPANTRLLSGHGPETTVGFEQKYNPFI
ncbi:MAG: MBL fold metallo-hydrolase [Chloroflexi bacterium HGW-Chloroflexi-10]|nr:MAG: MBL fold metallo-hydrolase [Chloroflexi bacterium HGW-Chloroflexi-10]